MEYTIILFYKYVDIADCCESLAADLRELCGRFDLSGRILMAPEGVNGNLGQSKEVMERFVEALLGVAKLQLRADDIKYSTARLEGPPFPDMRVKMVKHLIAGGELLDGIPIPETGQGYLEPEAWAEAAARPNTVLIDVRNARESAIGRFDGAIEPKTKCFSEFAQWLAKDATRELVEGKEVLMYCTGGVRCEKATALLRRQGVAASVHHLKGGIHRFHEALGDGDGLWQGKLFVFDRRGAMGVGDLHEAAGAETVVGRCYSCGAAHEVYAPDALCVVCREPCLVCSSCKDRLRGELHCEDHRELRECYFANLGAFSASELRQQVQALEGLSAKISKGREFKRRRRTLRRQIDRVNERLAQLERAPAPEGARDAEPAGKLLRGETCRSCGASATDCDGACWGFFGNERAKRLKQLA